jgi:lysyl endopeptidase
LIQGTMMKKNIMFSLVALAAVAAVTTTTTIATAQEMPGRAYSGEPSGNTPSLTAKSTSAPVKLRTLSAPIFDVLLAPTQKQLDDAAANASRVDAPSAKRDAQTIAEAVGFKKSAGEAVAVGPQRVASVFESKMKATSLSWDAVAGGRITQLVVSSTGAKGVRAQLHVPAGMTNGEIRVAANRTTAADILPLSLAQDGVIWTPYTEGDTQIVEIFTRQSVVDAKFRVGDVMHFERSLLVDRSSGNGLAKAAGSCNVDVACPSGSTTTDTAINDRKKSVAKINFRSGAGGFICTGTVINSQAFPAPYVMTANHCISTAAEAASVTTQWFRYAPTCGSGLAVSGGQSVEGEIQVGGGAQLVFTNHMADSTLLQLNALPPTGVIYSGWNAALLPNSAPVVSISHPVGDIMKFAIGSLAVPSSTSGQLRLRGYPMDMYGVSFTRGIIEGGSSGSGLFTPAADGTFQLRGVLSGTTVRTAGGLSCTNLNENATYGRFEIFYPQIQSYLAAQVFPTDDHPDQPRANAAVLPLNGTSVAGTISRPGDLDVFAIDVPSAGTLIVGSRGGQDLVGAILDANGAPASPVNDSANDDAEAASNDFGVTIPVAAGRYYVSVGHFVPSATTPNGYQVFAKFVTAQDNYTGMWWNEQESGWGINVNHQDNTLFATLFTYDATGRAAWFVLSNGARQADGSYLGDLLRTTGPAFNANPFTPIGASNITRVGSMRLSFNGSVAAQQTAALVYDVNGVLVSKVIKRQPIASPAPNCTFNGFDRSAAGNFTDMWWNPNESGWGLNIAHQADTIFATLFNYDQTGRDLWLVMANAPLQPGGTTSVSYQGTLFRTVGAPFNTVPFPPNPPSNVTPVGNMRVEFTTGNAGKLTYDFNGITVVKNIQRQVFGEARTSCARQ